MRRILLIVLVALLPLQWSGAAAAVRCLHAAAGHGPAGHGGQPTHADLAAHGDRGPHAAASQGHASHHHASHGHASHDHASHGHASNGHASHGHASHDHASHPHASQASQQDASAADGPTPAPLVDCSHADCGGCCHGGLSLPAATQPVPAPRAFGAAPATGADAPPASAALDGPFRPPRPRSA